MLRAKPKPRPTSLLRIILALLCFVALWATTSTLKHYSTSIRGTEATLGNPSLKSSSAPGAENSTLADKPDAITFAGVSGESPKYIETGEDRGMGWAEVETKEVRKGMKVDGFSLKQDWMTHSRIEYEIRQKHPICTYPYEWKPRDPLPKDRVLSIPLKLSGETFRSIYFNRDDAGRFKKHLDSKGNIKIESLLRDPSLSTRLVLARDYGTVSKILLESDAQGEARVKKEFESHIELRVLRETHQLVEMLRAKRFDYLLSDSIGKEDFAATHIPETTFEQLPYETLRIKDKADPNLALVSIACSNHPETLRAMPYFNKWIARFRGTEWITANLRYRGVLEPSFAKDSLNWEHTLTGRLNTALISGELDPKGFSFPSAEREPLPKTQKAPPRQEVEWKAFQLKGSKLAILGVSQFQALQLKPPRRHFDHRLMDFNQDLEQGSLWLNLTAREREEMDAVNTNPAIQAVHHFPDLFALNSRALGFAEGRKPLESLILFSQGLSPTDLSSALPLFAHPTLKEVRILGASTESGTLLVKHLPPTLTRLDLTRSSLTESDIQFRIQGMPLKALHLDSTQLTRTQLLALLKAIPETLEELSLGYLLSPWDLETAQAFGKKRWTQLKTLDLECDWLADQELFEIIKVLPPTLQTLKLGGNIFTGQALAALLKRPFPNLIHLGLSMSPIASINPREVVFPPSIRHLELSHTQLPGGAPSLKAKEREANDQNEEWLSLATLPPQLESLDLSYNDLSPKSLTKLLSHLAPEVYELNLAKTQLNSKSMEAFAKASHLKSIETLDLSFNPLDDEAIEILSKSEIQIQSLFLKSNRIRNRGAKIIAEKWLPRLNALNLSENPISELGLQDLSKHLSPRLKVLNLAGVLSIDSNDLLQNIPKELLELNLSGNLLTDHQMEVLGPKLPSGLASLDLNTSLLTSNGVSHLIHHLPTHLYELNLSRIPISSALLSQLLERLPPTLSRLHLSDLSLDATQSRSFAKSLPPQLSKLTLERVRLSSEALVNWFSQFPRALESLNLSQFKLPTSIDSEPSLVPSPSPHWPGNLRNFYLWETHLKREQFVSLVKNIPPSVQEIQFWGTQMTDEVLHALAEHPLENLDELDLMSEKLTNKGMRPLVQKARHLRELGAMNLPISGAVLKEMDGELLNSLRQVYFAHLSFSQKDLIEFVKKLHPDTWMICIPSNGITLSGVPAMIQALPKNLRQLIITGNAVGQKGLDLFRANKKEREERDGVPFRLIE